MHTGPVDFVSKDYPELHVLDNGIKHLGSNVSEWMDYSFKDYQRYFNCQNIEHSNDENSWDKNYRMVMGGNWYDEKTSLNYGAPLNSIYSKTFAHKDSAFCTVGFRYLIRITQKPKSADNYINDINKDEWNSVINSDYPFLKYEFLESLEKHNCVAEERGWSPFHVVVTENDKKIAIMPMYINSFFLTVRYIWIIKTYIKPKGFSPKCKSCSNSSQPYYANFFINYSINC